MRFILLGRPVSKKNGWKPFVNRRTGSLRMYQTAEARKYVSAVRSQAEAQARQAGFNTIPRPEKVAVAMFVYFHPNQHAMDVHNAQETVLDALQGFAYENDNQVVCHWTPPKRLVDKDTPRVEVVVRRASDVDEPAQVPLWVREKAWLPSDSAPSAVRRAEAKEAKQEEA